MPHTRTTFHGNMCNFTSFKIKVRSGLSQFSDLFSEFGKYIAPTYYHDRCERSVQMRLYSMHKREFVLVFAGFFACFILCMFIGLAGPPITSTVAINATHLSPRINQSDLATGPFILRSPTMSTYSQQMWVIAQVHIKNEDTDETFRKPFHVGVTIQGVSSMNQRISILDWNHTHNRTRILQCSGKACDVLTVLHLGFLDYSHYIITVQFFGLKSVDDKYYINEVTFYTGMAQSSCVSNLHITANLEVTSGRGRSYLIYSVTRLSFAKFKSYNPAFTQLEIWLRFVFLLCTFFITCWFAHSLRHFFYHDWSIEQKWMSLLLPLLLLYNDPVFPMSFLINSWMPGMLDAMFQASFLCALLLFWLCIYHGIRQNERRFVSFYFPKLLIVGLIWISAFTMASWQRYNELQDPTYNYKVDTVNFAGFKVFFFTVGGLYVFYLLYLIVRAYTELRSMPYFDVRLKFLTLLMLIVLSISIIITILRFGVSVLEDNFVAELSTTYGSSVEFMSFYGLLNCYLYTMAYVYSPSRNAHFETRLKDNPTLSMINDSDEEVIYGSDSEDRPLNPSHRGQDQDESD